MEENPYDRACRRLVKLAGWALVCWLLRVVVQKVRDASWMDTQLRVPGFPQRVCDTIVHLRRVDQYGRPWAVPIEFQVAPDETMPGRALIYEGLIWILEKPDPEVGDRYFFCCVVNLTGRGNCTRLMDWNAVADEEAKSEEAKPREAGTWLAPIEWNLEELDAGQIVEQVARGEAPEALLAFVSTMENGNAPATMKRWREVADLVGNARLKTELRLVTVFAQLTGCRDAWIENLEGFDVLESITVNEWKAETRGEDLIAILEDKFGAAPAELVEKVAKTTDLVALKRWLLVASRADSLAKFRQDAML